MTIPVQIDQTTGEPYLFNPGDMGEYRETSPSGYRNAVTGERLVGRYSDGQQKFTGGTSADGSPTLAKNHPLIEPTDIPSNIPWPKQLGTDPR